MDLLSLYLKQIAAFPLLGAAEEESIGKALLALRRKERKLERSRATERISEAEYTKERLGLSEELRAQRDRLITSNLRLVVSIAKRFQHCGMSLLDLINEGNLGLIDGVARFDPRRGCRFSTYGTWWIRQAITKALAEKGRTIRVPIYAMNEISRFGAISTHLYQELGREPTSEEIASFANVSSEKVESHLAYARTTSSLDAALDDGQEQGIGGVEARDDYGEPFELAYRGIMEEFVERVLVELDEREGLVIRLRFGLSGGAPLTLGEIGEVLQITRERVRQVQNGALRKLKSLDAVRELEPFG